MAKDGTQKPISMELKLVTDNKNGVNKKSAR